MSEQPTLEQKQQELQQLLAAQMQLQSQLFQLHEQEVAAKAELQAVRHRLAGANLGSDIEKLSAEQAKAQPPEPTPPATPSPSVVKMMPCPK